MQKALHAATKGRTTFVVAHRLRLDTNKETLIDVVGKTILGLILGFTMVFSVQFDFKLGFR